MNTTLDLNLVHDYLTRTRWFAGKGREFTVTKLLHVGDIAGHSDGPSVHVDLAEVTYSEGDSELYQLPLALYSEPVERLQRALIATWTDPKLGEVWAYDAVHDREAMAVWQRCFDIAADGRVHAESAVEFHRLPGHDLDMEAHSTLFAGEQSNSSVAFGEDAIMKVFRKITPGVNPDIQVHEVLTRAGLDQVAPLYGWADAVIPDDSAEGVTSVQLAMLQKFLRTASDGWDLAQASVRTLFAEPELHAAASGGDFAGEAARLGEALAQVHTALASHFEVEELDTVATGAAMTARLDAALRVVPELERYSETLRGLFARVGEVRHVPAQRIHGDLHLGQTMRTSLGWKFVDFEGEPAKPLHERLLPDSVWRDVAGMLRSFDYAPWAYLHHQAFEEERLSELAERATEWAHRCRNHFVVAYAGELDETSRLLLAAYLADKAVYECVYETRNRPDWLDIPLGAVARMTARTESQ